MGPQATFISLALSCPAVRIPYQGTFRKSLKYCLIFLAVALKLTGINETDRISNNTEPKITLRNLILVLTISALIVNSIILLSDPGKRHLTALLSLDITAGFATG